MLSEKQWTYKGEYVKVFKDGQWLPGKVKRTYFYGSKALSSVSISYWRQGTILERWCEDFELLSPQWRRDPFWRHNRSSLSIQNYYQHVDHFLEAETVPPPAYRAIYSGGKQWKKKNAPYHIARHKMPIYNSFLPENPVGIPCKSRKNPIYNTSSLTEPPFLSTEPNFMSPEPVFLPSEPAVLPTEPAFLPSEPALISPEPPLITPETTFLPTEPAFFDTEPAIISPEPAIISPEPAIISPEPTSLPSEPTSLEPTTAPLPEITETHAHSPNQENLAPNSSNSGLPDSHSEESVSVVIDLCLYFYVNILSENGEIRTEVGPQVVVLSSSDKVLSGPLPSPFVCSTFSA